MEFVTKLMQIAHYCSKHDNQCHGCIYSSKEYWCVPMELAEYLHDRCPDEWKKEEIKRRLNSGDNY